MDIAYDVFISYARIDAVRARLIRDQLEGLGLLVFFDTEGIDTGEEFPIIIDRAVKGARCVLGLWSRAAFSGRWVRIESRIGLDQNKLVAALLDHTRPEELPAEFYNVNVEQLADYRGQAGHEGWARCLRAIGKRVGRGDLSRAPAAAPIAAPTAKPINPLFIAGGALALIAAIALVQVLGKPAEPRAPGALAAPAAARAVDLTGAWTGVYRETGRETPFEVDIRGALSAADAPSDEARAFVGQVAEPNTFGQQSAQYLYAEISGQARPDGVISFVKTYNGAGGVGHSVQYQGRIDDAGRTITGTWATTSTQGEFRMDRR